MESGDGAAVESPCISICRLDPNDVCTGCYRTAGEIGAWLMLTDAERQSVLARARVRATDSCRQ